MPAIVTFVGLACTMHRATSACITRTVLARMSCVAGWPGATMNCFIPESTLFLCEAVVCCVFDSRSKSRNKCIHGGAHERLRAAAMKHMFSPAAQHGSFQKSGALMSINPKNSRAPNTIKTLVKWGSLFGVPIHPFKTPVISMSPFPRQVHSQLFIHRFKLCLQRSVTHCIRIAR